MLLARRTHLSTVRNRSDMQSYSFLVALNGKSPILMRSCDPRQNTRRITFLLLHTFFCVFVQWWTDTQHHIGAIINAFTTFLYTLVSEFTASCIESMCVYKTRGEDVDGGKGAKFSPGCV